MSHRIGDDWVIKLSAPRRAVREEDKLFYVYGNPDCATGNGVFSYPGAFSGETRNLTLDATSPAKVSLFGRRHDAMFGVNRGAQSYIQDSAYDFSVVGVFLPLATLFDGTFAQPTFPAFARSLDTHTRRETAYGLVRLDLADPFKLMIGGNYTHATSAGVSYDTPANYDRRRFLPFVGATLDLGATVSAYASFATIFNSQTELDEQNRILPPIEGDNIEAGLKGEWLGGRLNASAAIF